MGFGVSEDSIFHRHGRLYIFIKDVIIKSNWSRVELVRICQAGIVFGRFLGKVWVIPG